MNKQIRKHLLSFIVITVLVLPMLAIATSANAQTTNANDTFGIGIVGDKNEGNIKLGNDDPRAMAARIINVALGFLGILSIAIVLVGGFKWMTAMGNEEKVSDARKLMIAGVVGLAIVLAAWGLATFVLNSLMSATGAGGGSSGGGYVIP